MLFNIADIYEKPVNLDRLRFVPVTSAPTGWATNSRHFITFQTQYDNSPMWCSKPTEAVAYNISQVLENQKLRLISASELLDLLREVDNVLSENFDKSERFKKYYPESFTIIEFESNVG